MFVRWKKRLGQGKKWYKNYRSEKIDGKWKLIPLTDEEKPCQLSAYLVKSVRIDGKPRQQATFLASVQRKSVNNPHVRLRFWQTVQKRIQPFNLSLEQQLAVQEKLLVHVPNVTKEEIQKSDEEFAKSSARLKALMGKA